MEQHPDYSVCQVCGRIAPRGTDDWFDHPLRDDPTLRVIRCPKHWSVWALRQSVVGRSRALVEQVYRLKIKYEPWPDEAPFQPYPVDVDSSASVSITTSGGDMATYQEAADVAESLAQQAGNLSDYLQRLDQGEKVKVATERTAAHLRHQFEELEPLLKSLGL